MIYSQYNQHQYSQFGPAPAGVGDRWYEGIPNNPGPLPPLPSSFSIAVDAEKGGSAQDVAGVYNLRATGANSWAGMGPAGASATIHRVDATYVLTLTTSGTWHFNTVLIWNARTLYWRLGGPSGTVRCMARV